MTHRYGGQIVSERTNGAVEPRVPRSINKGESKAGTGFLFIALAALLLTPLAGSPSMPMSPVVPAAEGPGATSPADVDVFQGGFAPAEVSTEPGREVDVAFLLRPSAEARDASVHFQMPDAFVRLIKGDDTWRGELAGEETTRIELTILLLQPTAVFVRAEVRASVSGEVHSASYFLSVASPALETTGLVPSIDVGSSDLTREIAQPASRGDEVSPTGTITISGSWVYMDGSGSYWPMRRVLVKLMDEDAGGDEDVASTYTNDLGQYSFAVNNDDGWLQGGRDPYVVVYSQDQYNWVTKSGGLFGSVYSARTLKAGSDVPDGFSYSFGTKVPSANNEAWEAGDAALNEAIFLWNLLELGIGRVTIKWPDRDWPQSNGDTIFLPRKSTASWGRITLYHEFAHCVMYRLYGNAWPDGQQGGTHWITMEDVKADAWIEGWAEFMQAAVENNPDNLRSGGENIENNRWYEVEDSGDMDGAYIEGSVASILWDIWDPMGDEGGWYDTIGYTDQATALGVIIRVLKYQRPNDIEEFWDDFVGYYPSSAPNLSTIYWNYGIDKDAYPPFLLLFRVNYNAAWTGDRTVTLRVGAWDYGSGIDSMRFSNDGGVTWSPWYPFALEFSWVLADGDGTKTVTAMVRDRKGLVSEAWSDSIGLDTGPPTGSIVVNDGDPEFAASNSVVLHLTYSDGYSGVSWVRYSNDGTWDDEPWVSPTATKAWTLVPGDGPKRVYFQVVDRAGHKFSDSDAIVLDATPPEGSIIVNQGDPATSSTAVTLDLTYGDQTSGVDGIRISNDDQWDAAPWLSPAASLQWLLTGGDGPKTVHYQVRDRAGHVSAFADTIVLDTRPPSLADVPTDATVEASSAAGAIVEYAAPTATDAQEGDVAVACDPPSGRTFPLGTTTVTCEATDRVGNQASASFVITVRDTTAPRLVVPDDLVVRTSAPSGGIVTFDAHAEDVVDGELAVTCSPASGATLPVGNTTVICTAVDASGNVAQATFRVTVEFASEPEPTGQPTWILLAGILFVGGAGAALFVLRRRRQKTQRS